MPTLKQINCSVEIGPSNTKIQEYGARYVDGSVECFIPVPEAELSFTIHMSTRGYIASGLAMFIFIDGQYQCNRNKRCPTLPGASTSLDDYTIDFRVRQKEEKTPDGKFIGREWCFAELSVAKANDAPTLSDKQQRNVGTIEVVVLRCNYESQYLSNVQPVKSTYPTPHSHRARVASASSQHAPSIREPSARASSIRAPAVPEKASSAGMGGMSGFGGLFDGACDMNMDGAGDEIPDYSQAPMHSNPRPQWEESVYMGSTAPAPAYQPGPPKDYNRLTSANLNNQYEPYQPWGIDDRSTVHKHYGAGRIVTLPNTPEYDQEPAGADGLDGQGYHNGPPNIIINQYTRREPEPKEDIYLGQQGKARDDYKARIREQGHSVSGVSPPTMRKQPSQRQQQHPGYAARYDEYPEQRLHGADYRQGELPRHQDRRPPYMPQRDFHRDYRDAGVNDPLSQLRALREQTQQLERELRASHHGPQPRRAEWPHDSEQQRHRAPHASFQDPTPIFRHPAVAPGTNVIDPGYQRYCIKVIGDQGMFKFLELDKELLTDAVPYIALLRTVPLNNFQKQDWLRLKHDLDHFIAAGAFPDGTRIDRGKYKSLDPNNDARTPWPEHGSKTGWPSDKKSDAWPQASGNEWPNTNKQNNHAFWSPSTKHQNSHASHQGERRSEKDVEVASWNDPPRKNASQAGNTWDPVPEEKPVSRKQSSPSVNFFADSKNGANDNAWNAGNSQNQGNDTWNYKKPDDNNWNNQQQNNDAAGDWDTGNGQNAQNDESLSKKSDHHAQGNSWDVEYKEPKHDNNSGEDTKQESNHGRADDWNNNDKHTGSNNGRGNAAQNNNNGGAGDWSGNDNHGGGGPWDGANHNEPNARDQPNSPAHSVHSHRQAPPARSERAISNASTTNSRAHIKPYWADWRGTTEATAKDARKPCEAPREVYNYPAAPKPTVPANKPMEASHGVRPGRGADYVHKTFRPVYLDEMELPYAVFTFKYRSKDRLEKIIGRKVDKDLEKVVEEVERGQLLAMPKDKLVEHFMKLRSPTGGAKAVPSWNGNGDAAPPTHSWDMGSKADGRGEGWGDDKKKSEAGGAAGAWGNNSVKAPPAKANSWDHGSNKAPSKPPSHKPDWNNFDKAKTWDQKPPSATKSQDRQSSNPPSNQSSNKPTWDNSGNNDKNGWPQKTPSVANSHSHHRNKPVSQPGWDDSGKANNGGWQQVGEGNTGNNNGWQQTGRGNTGEKKRDQSDNNKPHVSSAKSAGKPPTIYTNDPILGRRIRDPDEPPRQKERDNDYNGGAGGSGSKSKPEQTWGVPAQGSGGGGFKPDLGGAGGADPHPAVVW